MNEWREALRLTKIEFRNTNSIFLFFILMFSLPITLLIVYAFLNNYFNFQSIGLDIVFLLFFTIFTKSLVPRINDTKGNEGHGNFSNYFAWLNSLAVKKEVIVKHRLLTSIFISVPIQIALLAGLYLISPHLSADLGIKAYLAFSIIWISYGMYIGNIFVVFQAGSRAIDWLSLFGGLLVIFLTIIVIGSDFTFHLPKAADNFLFFISFDQLNGLIYWTIFIAKTHPLLAIFISLFLAIVSFKFWSTQMLHRINRYDYM